VPPCTTTHHFSVLPASTSPPAPWIPHPTSLYRPAPLRRRSAPYLVRSRCAPRLLMGYIAMAVPTICYWTMRPAQQHLRASSDLGGIGNNSRTTPPWASPVVDNLPPQGLRPIPTSFARMGRSRQGSFVLRWPWRTCTSRWRWKKRPCGHGGRGREGRLGEYFMESAPKVGDGSGGSS
jgi:hypothetical protein